MDYLSDMKEKRSEPAAASVGKSRMTPFRTRRRLRLLPYALVIPIILYEGLLIVYPIAQGVYGSFTRIELAANRPRKTGGF